MNSKEFKKQIKELMKEITILDAEIEYFSKEAEENIKTGEVFTPGKLTIEFKQKI